jgi:serine/threonine-protein kinase
MSLRQALLDNWQYRPWIHRTILALLAGAIGVGWAVGRRLKTARANEEKLTTLTTLAMEPGAEQRSLIMQQIGNYRVVSLLGKGGMAEVYTAVPADTLAMSAAVAVKVMNRELRDDPSWMERFLREIGLCGQLVHPGIVELISHGEHQDGRFYMVMELIDGQELRKLLPELHGQWERIGEVLSQLMQAVDYAHQRGIYHRDLKPENIMITTHGRVKVMDFGLGRAVDSQTLTAKGAAMGTPRYIAPEAVAGEGADDRADQYSLGVIAYEMIVGRLPFEGDEVLYLLYSHAHLPPPPPSEVAGLPRRIDDVLLKMLSKLPRDRYRSVEEARTELLGALATLP